MAGERNYHHGNLRRALLDEGLQLLAEVGPHAFSLNALARRVGVSVAAPYRHFTDRNSLLDAIADEGYELFHDALKDAISGAANQGEAIRRIGSAYLGFAAQHKPHFGIMFRDREGRPNDVGAASFHTFAGAVMAAQAAGYLDPQADPRSLGRSIWSILHGAAVLEAYGGFSKLGLEIDRTQLAQELIEPFIRQPQGDAS